jgi:hypothetical protein
MTFVNTKTLAVLALAGLGAMNGAMPVRSGDTDIGEKVLAERMGASFAVGTKKAVAYYQGESGACNVTVLVSETYSEQLPYRFATVRFSANVAAGTMAQLDTSDGASLALTCAAGAKTLLVAPIDRVAYQAQPRATN